MFVYYFRKGGYLHGVIDYILQAYYHCTGLHICFLDTELQTILVAGSTTIIASPSLLIMIKGSLTTQNLTSECGLHYISVPYYEKSHLTGYFLIGPYRNGSSGSLEVAYKPSHCTGYLSELLQLIIKERAKEREERKQLLERTEAYLQHFFHLPLTLNEIADALYVSKSHLCYVFKNNKNMTVNQYLTKVRVEKSIDLLTHSTLSITEISQQVGYNQQPHFGRVFKKIVGISPSDYRKKYQKR